MCPRQQVADMDRGRASGAAVCTSDGRVLVMGGKARSQRAKGAVMNWDSLQYLRPIQSGAPRNYKLICKPMQHHPTMAYCS